MERSVLYTEFLVGLVMHWVGLISGMNYAVRGVLQQSELYI